MLVESKEIQTVLISESFDDQTYPENFGFDKGAFISDGVLTITRNMENGETSVKKFDPEIAGQSFVSLTFDWKSGLTEKGKTGIEFRDSYGRLVFALCAAYSDREKRYELRHSVTGVDTDSSLAPCEYEPLDWKKAELIPGRGYRIRLLADFAEKKVSYSIEDEEGNIAAEAEAQDCRAGSLAKMAACNYWTKSSSETYPGDQIIDNFKLTTSNTPIELPLKGKKVIAFGDSIIDGHVYKQAGFVEFTAEKEGMVIENNYANNGAQIMPGSTADDEGLGGVILDDQIQAAAGDGRNPDFIIFDGGTNDAYETVLDKLGDGDDPDPAADTFAGAFRNTILAMKRNWPKARIIYVAAHKLGARSRKVQEALHKLELDICKKQGVAVANLYDDSELDTSNAEMRKRYSSDILVNGLPVPGPDPTGTHPNFLAIEEFYVPLVSETLRKNNGIK